MPAKPTWLSDIDEIVRRLEALPRPWVDRATVEFLLGVGRRRAQQILAPCVKERVGANGLADREALIAHLRRLVKTGEGNPELARRRRFASTLDRFRDEQLHQPRLLIEAPTTIVNQKLADLPPGVAVEAGRITVTFSSPEEALEKLLALAMAIGNDVERFAASVEGRES